MSSRPRRASATSVGWRTCWAGNRVRVAGVKYLAIGLDHFAVPDEDPMLKMTDGDLFAAVLPEQNHRRLDDMLEDVELMADAEAAGVAQLAAR